MRLLDKSNEVAPATTTAYVEDPKDNASNKLIRAKTELENADHHHINPEIEKAVRRKFDLHVVPLVTALCSFVPIYTPASKAATSAEAL